MDTLVKKGDVSKSRYDKAEADINSAKAQVQVAKAQVDEAKINLSYCSMYSPIDGIISKRYVDVGNLVGTAEQTLLATVVQVNPIYVEFNPSVADLTSMLKYRKNMPFAVSVSMPEDKLVNFSGKVDLINNEADITTSTILMRAVVENKEKLLLPGIYVNLKVRLADKVAVLLVPTTATIETQGRRSVFVVDKSSKVGVRQIKTSGTYKDQFIVNDGLEKGDVVVTSRLQILRPGMQVQVENNK